MFRANYSHLILCCVIALLASSCSLFKMSLSTGDPLSKEDRDARLLTRAFYYDFSNKVAKAADSIAKLSTDPAQQIAAIRWKLRATRAASNAATQSMPEVAIADMWILCRNMKESLQTQPDSLLFGPFSDIARTVAEQLNLQIEGVAEQTLRTDRFDLMQEFITQYIAENPALKRNEQLSSSALSWIEFLRNHKIENSYSTGTLSEQIAEINGSINGQISQFSNTLSWSKELLDLQLAQDSLRLQLNGRFDALEKHFERVVSVAEQLPQLSDTVLYKLNSDLQLILHEVDGIVANTFSNIDLMRSELQHYLSQERETLVKDASQMAKEMVQTALDRLPNLVGKILLFAVFALLVLLGVPFTLGYWTGRWRERSKAKQHETQGKSNNS